MNDEDLATLERRVAFLEYLCEDNGSNGSISLKNRLDIIEKQINDILASQSLLRHVYEVASRTNTWNALSLVHTPETNKDNEDIPLEIRIATTASKLSLIKEFSDGLFNISTTAIPDPAECAHLSDLVPTIHALEANVNALLSQHEQLALRSAQLERFYMQNILLPDNNFWAQLDERARQLEHDRRQLLTDCEEY